MQSSAYRGFSLLELLAVVAILGIIAVVVVPRIGVQGFTAKAKVCSQYTSDINAAIERYYFDNGAFPSQLSDLTPEYYPEAIPPCPATGLPYTIDATKHTIVPHSH